MLILIVVSEWKSEDVYIPSLGNSGASLAHPPTCVSVHLCHSRALRNHFKIIELLRVNNRCINSRPIVSIVSQFAKFSRNKLQVLLQVSAVLGSSKDVEFLRFTAEVIHPA